MAKNITSLGRNFLQSAYMFLLQDYGRDPKNTTILAGVGRSGTTWIADCINYKQEYRYLFEPFNRFTPLKKLRGKFLSPGQEYSEESLLINQLLKGQIRGMSIDFVNYRNHQLIFNKRLIKAITGNLLLPWIQSSFPSIQIILLLRHPCPVSLSRIQRNWHSLPHFSFDDYIANATQLGSGEELKNLFADARNSILPIQDDCTIFDQHIITWCIHYAIPLRLMKSENRYISFYESFCLDPEFEFKKLFQYLGKELDFQLLNKKVTMPSASTGSWSDVVNKKNPINSWKEKVSAEQEDRAHYILQSFGLDNLYDSNSLPVQDPLKSLG